MFWSKNHTEFLHEVSLFAHFDDAEIKSLDDLLKERVLKGREVLFETDEAGDAAYIVFDGTITVNIEEKSGRIREVAKLNKGDILGQVALLDGGPRSATCMADSNGATVLRLSADKFQRAFDKGKPIAFKILDVLSRVLVGQFRNANSQLAKVAARQRRGRSKVASTPEIMALFDRTVSRMASIPKGAVDVQEIRNTFRLD